MTAFALRSKSHDFPVLADALTQARFVLDGAGPVGMLELSAEQVRGLVDPRLWTIGQGMTADHAGLVLCGPTGIGKTLTAVAMVRRLLEAGMGHGVVWSRAIDLASARSRHPLGSEAPRVDACIRASVLVLDDLGWEARDGAIADVISSRYDAERTSIITTGLLPAELEAKYGAAFVRRIVESGGRKGRIVSLFGKAAK